MVLLPWTPPYDWAWMVGFLQARAVAGVERFHDGGYSRSFGVEGHRGLIHLTPDEEAQGLRVSLSPGLRLPGALDAFEQAVRAVLGQLVSVAMAARLTAKVAAGWGEPLAEAPGYVLFPTPEALSRADPQALKALGMPLRRAEALIHLARAALSGELPLTAPADIDAGLRQLQTLPGIGRWTANYFALRGWQAKDIFLPDDYLIKQRFPGMTPAAIARYARRWQPMRSYALLHIWYTDDWAPAAE
ncbi:DNA-3-methyladenine glycosylase 2 [Klebsiella pneumoniae]|nr:DNA-3-methyladenine glycosylase 2 [Klebsiella pneumoniae]QPG81240.1 DNA-3-methyladenine glycosylase 2 [Klebsiella pneumoniae]